MKILFIAPRYDGGIGGHAKRVAEKLNENGFDVSLMQVPNIPIKKLKNPSFALFGSLKAILSKEEYDVAHAFNVPSAFVMKYVKARKKILSVHGVYSEQISSLHSRATSGLVSLAESSVLKWADKLTTDSKTVQKQYKEKLGLDFECLYAPLDTAKFEEIPEGKRSDRQVTYVGRDSFEKGIDVLRQAESQIDGKVVYCTNVSWHEAMKALRESTVLAVPSRMESIPQVIKEAFYLKIPVVATAVGGVPELITDKVTGLLVPPEDPKKLSDAINEILHDAELGKRLANSAFDFVMNRFTWETLLPKYKKFYEEIIS